jgi:hypothetical protein
VLFGADCGSEIVTPITKASVVAQLTDFESEFLTDGLVMTQVYWDTTLCRPANSYLRLGGAYCLLLQGQ